MTATLIMAGGASERMRASAGPRHKALIPVLGVPMLERNLLMLLAAGMHHIVVAVNAQEVELKSYVRGRARSLAEARGATIECLEEIEPLGTIGAARSLSGRKTVLVVNVDNLTSLNLKELVRSHLEHKMALTIATHLEPFRIPFGEVVVRNGQVLEYMEKPVRRIAVSSGTYVLDAEACNLIPEHRRTDLPDLFRILTSNGKPVQAFEHDAAWIDVNDALAVARAEQLIAEHRAEFECWNEIHQSESVDLLLLSPAGILVQRSTHSREWHLPGSADHSIPAVEPQTVALALQRQTNCYDGNPESLTCFDDLDADSRTLVRRRVFWTRTANAADAQLSGNWKWISIDALDSLPPSSGLTRSVAWLRRIL